MKDKELERANYLKKRIKDLEIFIWSAERLSKFKLIKEKYIFETIGEFNISSQSIIIDRKIAKVVIDEIKQNLKEMKEELENL